MSWLRADRDGTSWSWIIFARYAGGAIELPTFPVDDFDYHIAAGDEVMVLFTLAMKTPGGYDAVRPRAFESAPEGFLEAPPGPSGVRSWVEYE